MEEQSQPPINEVVTPPTVEEMLSETLRLTREVHEMAKKTKRYMAIRAVMGVVYFVLLVAPIVLAIIFLPPVLKPALDQMQTLLNISSPSGLGAGTSINTEQLLQLFEQSR